MNVFKPLIGIFCLTLLLLHCSSPEQSSQEDNPEISSDTIIKEETRSFSAPDPLILGIWKLGNSAINGEIIQFQAENSGLKTITFYEDGKFEEHQVIENEMVVGEGAFHMDGKMLETSIETDDEPLMVSYTIEKLTDDSLVMKGIEESAAFTFYYVKVE